MSSSGQLIVRKCKTSADGSNRLSLIYREDDSDGDVGYWFEKLVWERAGDQGWTVVTEITQQQLEARTDMGLWVSDIHEFYPARGSAVLQFGETSHGRRQGGWVIYSWRLWDLTVNSELDRLAESRDPFVGPPAHGGDI